MVKKQKEQKDDDFLSSRVRGFAMQRNYDFDTSDFDEELGEKVKKPNAPSESEWREMIYKLCKGVAEGKGVEFCYAIFHDKDKLTNGDIKPLHVHIVIKYTNARTVGSVLKKFGISRTQNISKIKSYNGALKYLLHVTNDAIAEGKYIYGQDQLMMFVEGKETKSDEHFKELITSKKDDDREIQYEIKERTLDMLTELRQIGTKPNIQELYKEYPEYKNIVSDTFYSYKGKMSDAEVDYFEDLAKQKKLNGRNLKCTYIYGPGGTGKSTLAKAISNKLADERGVHYAAAKSDDKTYDFVSKYNYQKVSVLNEMEGSSFNPREMMDVFDNHNYTPISSRNVDKDWLAENVFMTSSKSFTRFRNESFRYSKGGKKYVDEDMHGNLKIKNVPTLKDEAFQFTRRFTYNIQIVKHKDYKLINLFVFDEEKYGYRLQKQYKVSKKYYLNASELDNLATDILATMDNKDIDITKGKVMRDVDLMQDENDIDAFETYRNIYNNESKKDLEKLYKKRDIANKQAINKFNKHKEFNERVGIKESDIIAYENKKEENPYESVFKEFGWL